MIYYRLYRRFSFETKKTAYKSLYEHLGDFLTFQDILNNKKLRKEYSKCTRKKLRKIINKYPGEIDIKYGYTDDKDEFKEYVEYEVDFSSDVLYIIPTTFGHKPINLNLVKINRDYQYNRWNYYCKADKILDKDCKIKFYYCDFKKYMSLLVKKEIFVELYSSINYCFDKIIEKDGDHIIKNMVYDMYFELYIVKLYPKVFKNYDLKQVIEMFIKNELVNTIYKYVQRIQNSKQRFDHDI